MLLSALKQTNPKLAEKTTHISHGMVRLPEGKMSSRTGKVISAEWLINEVEGKITEIVVKSSKVEKDQVNDTSEKLAISSIKYSFLKNSIGKDISFDFDESLSLEGNSGPYLEYTFARCNSILTSLDSESEINFISSSYEMNEDEMAIMRQLVKYPETVSEAAQNYAPHLICNYLFNLAQKYNLFYHNNPILKSTDEEKMLRLMITEATAQVLQNGLHLLGIQTVEKM